MCTSWRRVVNAVWRWGNEELRSFVTKDSLIADVVLWCLLLWCCWLAVWSGRGFKAFLWLVSMGNQTWIHSCDVKLRWGDGECVCVCVCLMSRDQEVCMISVIAFVQMYLQAMLPFSFSSSVISNSRWNLRRLPYLRSITVGDFDEGFVNCLVFLCVLWRWFAVWRGFNALAPYYGKPNLNAPIWNFPEVIGCVCCLMCLVQDMCMILVTAFVFV